MRATPRHSPTSRVQTTALLRDNGASAAQTYRFLTDEQLARTRLYWQVLRRPRAGLISYLAIGEINATRSDPEAIAARLSEQWRPHVPLHGTES